MPVETSLTIDVSAFEALLDRIEAGLEDGLLAGVHAGGAQVQEDARLRCPVLNGPLRASIRLDGPHVVGRSIEARVVAGEGLAYARVQHDRTDLSAHGRGSAVSHERRRRDAGSGDLGYPRRIPAGDRLMGGADAQIVALIEAKNQMSGELATLRRDLGKFADAGEKSSGRFGRAMRTAGKWAAVGIAAASAAAAAAGFAMLKLGSDAEEARNVTGLAFSTMGDKVRKWAEDYALATGSSSYSSIEAASDMGLLFKGMRLSEDASFDLSTKMVKLAGDMASAKNVPLDIALEKIRAGLVGEAEPLRTMGVLLSAARVKEEAYASGIAQTGVELTETQKVMARANIIMNDSIAMHDDLENTQASAANQVRRFWNEIKDGATIVGEALQPALEAVLAEVTGLTGELKDGGAEVAAYVRKWLSDGGLADIKKAVADVREGLEKVVGAIIAIGPYLPGIAKGIGVVLTGVIAWKVGMIAVAVATTTATAGLNLVIPALVAGGAALAAWADYGRDSVDSADALDRKIDVLNTRLEHAYSRWDLTNDQVRANVEAMRGARDAAVLERDALDSLNRQIKIATGEVEGLNTGLDWTPPKARKVEAGRRRHDRSYRRNGDDHADLGKGGGRNLHDDGRRRGRDVGDDPADRRQGERRHVHA